MDSLEIALSQALHAATKTLGATAPNPPVGAAILDAHDKLLALEVHKGAGHPHAEALVIHA